MWSGFAAVSIAYTVAMAYCVSAYYEDDGEEHGGAATAEVKKET